MADYWVLAKIGDEQRRGDTPAVRRSLLLAALHAQGRGFWDSESSLIAIRSDSNIDVLARALRATIDPKVDWLVVREIGRNCTRYVGYPGPGFLAFFPQAIEV